MEYYTNELFQLIIVNVFFVEIHVQKTSRLYSNNLIKLDFTDFWDRYFWEFNEPANGLSV